LKLSVTAVPPDLDPAGQLSGQEGDDLEAEGVGVFDIDAMIFAFRMVPSFGIFLAPSRALWPPFWKDLFLGLSFVV
jgi:hypothetical protein